VLSPNFVAFGENLPDAPWNPRQGNKRQRNVYHFPAVYSPAHPVLANLRVLGGACAARPFGCGTTAPRRTKASGSSHFAGLSSHCTTTLDDISLTQRLPQKMWVMTSHLWPGYFQRKNLHRRSLPFCRCGTAVHAAQKRSRHGCGGNLTHPASALVEEQLRDTFEIHGMPKDRAAASQFHCTS
jgi:hypothetical protein